MAMPKKKMTSTRSGNRRAQQALRRPAITVCSHCQVAIKPHTVCQFCGYYRGVKIS